MNSCFSVLVYIIGVLIAAIAQILLKKSANKKYDTKIKEYLNLPTIFAYILLFSSTLCSLTAFKSLPLLLAPVLGTLEYIFVAIFSKIFLNEKIIKRKLLGLILVIFGVLFFAL